MHQVNVMLCLVVSDTKIMKNWPASLTGDRLLGVRCLTLSAPEKPSYNANYKSSTREAAMAVQQCAGLLAFYADHHVVPLPPDHRFPMIK